MVTQFSQKTNLKFSRLGLGTAELGFAYGLGGRHLPSEEESIRLLLEAVEAGITFFDTAVLYGLSLERIRKSGITKIPGVIIGAKGGHFLETGENLTPIEIERKLREEVETCLQLLKLDVLTLFQLHGGTKEQIESGTLLEILKKLRSEGKIVHFGISTRGEDAPLAAIATREFTAIQTAYSILDQRMSDRVLPEAKQNNVTIINRSVLLKGVLAGAPAKLPNSLSLLRASANKAKKLATEAGMSLSHLAIRFAISNEAITCCLIGTNKYNHLKEALAAVAAGPLSQDLLDELFVLRVDDPQQVDPSKWPKF